MKMKIVAAAVAVGVVTAGAASSATVVIGAVAVSPSAIDASQYGDANNIINQTGLSANYVSGRTDFDSFTASTTAAYDYTMTSLGLGGVAGLGSYFFDLGNSYGISGVATWGQDGGTATTTGFDLYWSDTFGAAGSRNLIGSFSAGRSPNALVDSFGTVTSRFFEIDVTSNQGHSTSRFQEVVFGGNVSAVPVPASLPLLAVGFGVLGYMARRKRKAA